MTQQLRPVRKDSMPTELLYYKFITTVLIESEFLSQTSCLDNFFIREKYINIYIIRERKLEVPKSNYKMGRPDPNKKHQEYMSRKNSSYEIRVGSLYGYS